MIERTATETSDATVIDVVSWQMHHLYVNDRILLAYIPDQIVWIKHPLPGYEIADYEDIVDDAIAIGISSDMLSLSGSAKQYLVAYSISLSRKFIRYFDGFLLVDCDESGNWYRSSVPMTDDERGILNILTHQLQDETDSMNANQAL